MENASKALIIAGAILVSILLISMGVAIISQSGNMSDDVGSTTKTMAIETFNSQFTSYEGDENTASQIRSLVSKVRASNATNEVTTAGEEKFIELVWVAPLTGTASLSTTRSYTVTLGTDTTTGYINRVSISQ